MDLLVLGGTRFVGRHIVEAAQRRGHRITLFHRGQPGANLFPDAEHVHGDRDSDLGALRGRRWHAAIDSSAYFPRQVRSAIERLTGNVEHYTFISTISIYTDFTRLGITEDAPVHEPIEDADEKNPTTYGGLKVMCERLLTDAFPHLLIARPGIIVGPHDYKDRFTYWVRRAARGGEVLAPGRPERPVQLIDARDLADWIVRMIESGSTGTYNAVGPADVLRMDELLATCREVSGSDACFTWVSDELLTGAGITFESDDVPFWIPAGLGAGFFAIDTNKARAAGLRFRPLAQTARDTLDWDRARQPFELPVGLSPEREAELLRAWQQQ